jgi:iron complex transport system substrate-binding protein
MTRAESGTTGRIVGASTMFGARAFVALLALVAYLTHAAAQAPTAAAHTHTDAAQAPTALIDDLGRELHLHRKPQRIVSLAPHATELLHEAGAGAQLVAVDVNSDHPP